MAGGVYSSMNKIRPGAYINFEGEPVKTISISDRGIVAMDKALDWGAVDSLIEITASDLASNGLLAKTGLAYDDATALEIKLALQNCSLIKLYNKNTEGNKATTTLGTIVSYHLTTDAEIVSGKTYYTRTGTGTTEDPYVYTPVQSPDVSDIGTYYEKDETVGLVVTAKYAGTFGNKIAILVTVSDTIYTVETYANGYFVDRQRVASAADLVDNDFVTFPNKATATLVEQSSTLLAGGTTGATQTNELDKFFTKLLATRFTTLAQNSTDASVIASTVNFIRNARDNEGKYVQAVVANASTSVADYEGIINVVNGVVLEDDTSVSAAQFTAWVAGATAGADIIASNTGKVVEGAKSIVGQLDNDEIIQGLAVGKYILSLNQNGTIKVEKDINSYHTFTADKNYVFSKNRVIRELDEIGTHIEDIWENTYLGKVTNNDNGRMLFKSSIIDYLTGLQNIGAIDNFDSSTVEVIAGDDVDSVIASIAIKPLDSMEFLYLTVNVEQ